MNRLLDDPQIATFTARMGRETVKSAVNEVLEAARRSNGVPSFDVLRDCVSLRLAGEERGALCRVINATGVLLHTNLGRAPIAADAIDAIAQTACGYSNLEYDVESGARGSRYDRASSLLRRLTGADDALVVNNCAAAMLLIVEEFACGREVVTSHGELVEIGGGFRVPEILQRAGATLVAVGTTNRTRIGDYRKALSPHTALLLRTHASNFSMRGFTERASSTELAELARTAGIPYVEDLGSGAMIDFREYGLPHERTVQEAVQEADVVAFSGDKLLGGPQAGIIVGKHALVARLKNNPLLRALRVDKLTLSALVATLHCYRNRESRSAIPLFAMLEAPLERLRERAERYASAVPGVRVEQSVAYAGGGTLPQAEIASIAAVLNVRSANAALAALRRPSLPIVARAQDGEVVLDLRTIAPADDEEVVRALRTIA